MNTTEPARTLPSLDDSLYAAGDAIDRIRNLLAYIYADLTGADEGQEGYGAGIGIGTGAGIAMNAHLVRLRLEEIADKLPFLREVISSPKVAQLRAAGDDVARSVKPGYAGMQRGGYE